MDEGRWKRKGGSIGWKVRPGVACRSREMRRLVFIAARKKNEGRVKLRAKVDNGERIDKRGELGNLVRKI